MKKLYFALAVALTTQVAVAQNPGLVISEFMANPSGNDNSLEWVELKATKAIDFSVTPYSVVVNNNGTATANGWIQGGTISYGFNISSGSVAAGDVVYVGGSAMAPTGTKIYVKDVQTTAGDGFGSIGGTAGVFGNGGGNADGIAVFSTAIGSVTSSTVPVDAIFYGTGIGSALVTAGTAGYQLPVNDTYNGGKLQSGSFFAGDPGGDITVKATGTYNTATNSWSGPRSWATGAFVNDNASAVQLSAVVVPGTATISLNNQIVNESAGTATVNVTFSNANSSAAKIVFGLSPWTNATQNSDFSWTSDTLVIPANSNGTFPFTITINNDLLAERTERIIVKIVGSVNATIAAANYQIIHVKDNDYVAPVSSNELQMQLLTSFNTGAEGTNSAEIVTFDPTTDRLYTANSIGGKIDIIDFSNPAVPVIINSISMAPYGGINSLVVHNGIVAAAIENSNPQANGSVVFFDSNGAYLNQVTVGAMPDMITFNNNFTKILVACEGEPKTDYSVDPEGSVGIVDLTPGIAALTNANVTIANFQAYNGQEAALRAQGVRIFGPGSSAAQDFEPEYITISEDNATAYVTLQENNAMAVVNIATGTVTAIRPLGLMDYSSGNGLDPSDQTSDVLISSIPVKGAFMPDGMAHATISGTEYLFTANEGDAREFTAVVDVARISATSLDPTAFPDQNILKNNAFLGRLNALQATGDTDGDGDKDEIHVLGTRSFSIWNAQTGALVFDSKDWLEQITASHPTLAGLFNASNTSGTAVAKNRSDDKGPEPEGVTTAVINGRNYLFVSLERIGGVMMFNIENPSAPVFSGYYNNRTVGANSGPDRGAEGIIYIKAEDSPNGESIVILANEVSSTLSIYQVKTCVALAGAEITAAQDTICANQTTVLSIQGHPNSTVQWLKNDIAITGATGNTYTANTSGEYRVYVSNTAFGCADTSVAQAIVVNPLPVVAAGADQTICMGTAVTLTATGATTYSWNNGVTNGTAFTPTASSAYIVTGTNANNCQNTDTVTVTVNTLPAVSAGANQTICAGDEVTLTATGATTYSWNNGVTNGMAFAPNATSAYVVTGTDANNCQNTDTVNVTVNTLPAVSAGANQTICAGDEVTLTATGATNYSWNNGVTNGMAFEPTATSVYIVTGTDANNCENTDTVNVTVNTLPAVSAGTNQTICAGDEVTLTATGATTYSWNNGVTNGTAFAPDVTSAYIVTGTDANNCQNMDTVIVTVNELPVADLGADLMVCEYNFPVTLNAGTGFYSYTWNNGSTGSTLNAAAEGTYSVTVEDANGCEGTDSITITADDCLGLNELEASVKVYPNPASEFVTVKSTENEPVTVILRSVSGQELLTETANSEVKIDVRNLAPGTYFLQVIRGNRQQQFTIQKQ